MLATTDLLRIKANNVLDPDKKGALGQFFTPKSIALFMASLFNQIDGDVKLLDPGCGPGSLTAAFVDEAIRRGHLKSLDIYGYEIENDLIPFINETITGIQLLFSRENLDLTTNIFNEDFILHNLNYSGLFKNSESYTHIIMNPPYKKIHSDSVHRKALSKLGIETVNLYSAFVALALQKLQPDGELVAIIPRSFCNGAYYQSFRDYIFERAVIKHIHLFDSRSGLFKDEDILQENLILHLVKNNNVEPVKVSSSPSANFFFDFSTGTITALDMTVRDVPYDLIVQPEDKKKFIHIPANNRDDSVIKAIAHFSSSLEELPVSLSTGPVVRFRVKNDLCSPKEPESYPLLSPCNLAYGIQWPRGNKPSAIKLCNSTKKWLWKNEGFFVLVNRFSSKDEKKRIKAEVYDGSLPGKFIGFDNKINVFHLNKTGFDRDLAYGLFVYLNSSLLDHYYRLFGGHTQVNAADLQYLNYPREEVLKKIGKEIQQITSTQENIDSVIERELSGMAQDYKSINQISKKVEQATSILNQLGLPRAQQNERSGLTLLALLNLPPELDWSQISSPMIGVTPIMNWCAKYYGKDYAPNTRETFRRQTLHQFIEAGICLYNPDDPERAVNSPKACYQIAPEVFELLRCYGTDNWNKNLKNWLKQQGTLVDIYSKERDIAKIPLVIADGSIIKLSPGEHSQLISDIVTEFGPRFVPGAEVIYLGDTGSKTEYLNDVRLNELGVVIDEKGKLPDVILYDREREWLLLIESVTSHGPMDNKRYLELSYLFSSSNVALVYVTAFPDRHTMTRFLSDISWETEVWVADSPSHMIHFNGDKFLGPY